MRITLRLFPAFLICVGFLLVSCSENEPEDPPNILWITSEDNSPFIGAYGDTLATTPNIDRLADRGMVYEHAYATTPVCAPARFTIITGTYANSMGTENMRSTFRVPDFIRFFPAYLQDVGYHTTNNSKKDYNTVDQPEVWNESSSEAHYSDRDEGQPFFHVRNLTVSHESSLHPPIDTLHHDPEKMLVPPYHPDTDVVRRDRAKYYDQVMEMDRQLGQVLQELEESGEAENTIVFYYSDHGGVLPRSKRYMFESGLRVPLVVYVPSKYEHLVPGSATDRMVSFVDLAPTVLSIAGIEPPDWMQGTAFLGKYSGEPREMIYAYRARMDERYDLARAVRDTSFLYVRNYMTNRIYGQHVSYLWRSRTMQEWDRLYQAGELNETQSRFFQNKPAEELYHVKDDPHNVRNLVNEAEHRETLQRLRQINRDWILENRDLGFIQEYRISNLSGQKSLWETAREEEIPIQDILNAADFDLLQQGEASKPLQTLLEHPDATVRYWAVMQMAQNEQHAKKNRQSLTELEKDESPSVRLITAEAYYQLGEQERANEIILEGLEHADYRVQLLALNVLQAQNPHNLPGSLKQKIEEIYEMTIDGNSGSDYYLNRASEYLLSNLD
jgi:arylsulfatase A-like enzyme